MLIVFILVGLTIYAIVGVPIILRAIADKITDVIEYFYPVSIPPVKEYIDNEAETERQYNRFVIEGEYD